MHRRHFLQTAFGAAATAAFGSRAPLWGAKASQAGDIVSLGPDKIKLTRPQYRLVYHVDDSKRRLTIIAVGSRQDIYNSLQNRQSK